MTSEQPKRTATRYLIFNADDFGASEGINRGIVESHQRGVLTSTSMMVTGRAVEQAVSLGRENPQLAIGLHFDVWGEDEREFDTHDLSATHDEFLRQMDRFYLLVGRAPTHVDSHRHAHRQPHLFPHFQSWASGLDIPIRGDGKVNFVGGFYAQWEWKVTNLEYVSVEFLRRMILNEVPPGITEFSCHPGYAQTDYLAAYNTEREEELRTLTDPRVRRTIAECGIDLISYCDYNRIRERSRGSNR